MADKIAFEIVTPEKRLLSAQVDEVVLPSVEGYLGVLPGHAPLLALLRPGEVSYRVGDVRRYVAVSGGYAEVLRHSVSVLARTAELAEEIDVERARRARDESAAALGRPGSSEDDVSRAAARLDRATARIQVYDRKHT